ncbi:MAG: Fic family protein [Dehalococcoidia bacterium]
MAFRGRPTNRNIHNRLAFEVAELRDRLGGLPTPEEAEGIWTEIWYHEAHNSTAIEGNTLVLREVAARLAEGRAVGNKELKDYLEVRGYADAAQWVYGQAHDASGWTAGTLLSLTEVREAHRLAMGPVWEVAPHPNAFAEEAPGNWRRHNIHPFAGGMPPPDHSEIPALVHDWVADVHAIREDTAPIAEAVAKRHVAFERIHPFIDGNGRTGRLLMNLVLVRLGYPPAVIQKRDRAKYLEALNQADRGAPQLLGELIARAVLENLMRFVLPAVAGPVRLIPLEALADGTLSIVALRNAVQRSRLRAVRGPDGAWRSSKQWVDEYRSGRYETLRQPRRDRPLAQERS